MSKHAIQNAKSWLETIVEWADALETDEFPVKLEGETFEDADSLRERVLEAPLSVQVRDGWRSPYGKPNGPEEFMILLTTGGPALRIIGDIDQHCCPESPRLEWQDWGEPWTELETTNEEDDALRVFAEQFNYGE